jgi:hypothetical protein
MDGVECDGDSFDWSGWRIAWAGELFAFTVHAAGDARALVFDDLDEIEIAMGRPLPWALRARLETDQHLALEEQVGNGRHRRRHRSGSVLVAPRGDVLATPDRIGRRRPRR